MPDKKKNKKKDYRLTLSAFVGDAERKARPLKSYCEKFWSWHNSELIKSSLLYNIVDVDKSHAESYSKLYLVPRVLQRLAWDY